MCAGGTASPVVLFRGHRHSSRRRGPQTLAGVLIILAASGRKPKPRWPPVRLLNPGEVKAIRTTLVVRLERDNERPNDPAPVHDDQADNTENVADYNKSGNQQRRNRVGLGENDQPHDTHSQLLEQEALLGSGDRSLLAASASKGHDTVGQPVRDVVWNTCPVSIYPGMVNTSPHP